MQNRKLAVPGRCPARPPSASERLAAFKELDILKLPQKRLYFRGQLIARVLRAQLVEAPHRYVGCDGNVTRGRSTEGGTTYVD